MTFKNSHFETANTFTCYTYCFTVNNFYILSIIIDGALFAKLFHQV